MAACAPFLKRQLEVLDPALIVTLGRFSIQTFMPGARISGAHGTTRPANPPPARRTQPHLRCTTRQRRFARPSKPDHAGRRLLDPRSAHPSAGGQGSRGRPTGGPRRRSNASPSRSRRKPPRTTSRPSRSTSGSKRCRPRSDHQRPRQRSCGHEAPGGELVNGRSNINDRGCCASCRSAASARSAKHDPLRVRRRHRRDRLRAGVPRRGDVRNRPRRARRHLPEGAAREGRPS